MVKFISGNQNKIDLYKLFINKFDTDFDSEKLDLTEIQTDNAKELAIAKARQAFSIVNHPLFINDASWEIPALNGFPGPYMKYMNKWLTSEDFLRLMSNIRDRRVVLKDFFACIDRGGRVDVFEASYNATMITTPIGKGYSIDRITRFDSVGKTISEVTNEDKITIFGGNKIWENLANWIIKNN